MSRARALGKDDTDAALALYRALTLDPRDMLPEAFHRVIAHSGTTVIGVEVQGAIASMLTLHLLPNVTQGGRPYGLIENVVTLEGHRGRGFGRMAMEEAARRAWAEDAYKIMLLSGSHQAEAFYRALGFSADDKTGFVMRRGSHA